jgi:hypothetical protein
MESYELAPARSREGSPRCNVIYPSPLHEPVEFLQWDPSRDVLSMQARMRNGGGMPLRPQTDQESTHVLFAIQLRIGDRFTDLDGAWEIVGGPSIVHDGKTIEARVARPNDPRSIKHMTWATHERIPVRRSAGRHEPRG